MISDPMSQFQRPPGSVDVKIKEIPEGNFRVRLLGTVVAIQAGSLILNDGEDQLMLKVGSVSISDLTVGDTIRAICMVQRSPQGIGGTIFAWNKMTADQILKYWRLVKIERRVPKE
ncbi:MAG: hypothetical protein ACXAE3_05705 [Candidatus Kariarchaeaceae archaeon]|jgi:hypothetical protein